MLLDKKKLAREIRHQGISVPALASKSGVGQAYLYDLRNNSPSRGDATLETIVKLASGLNIPVYKLLSNTIIKFVMEMLRDKLLEHDDPDILVSLIMDIPPDRLEETKAELWGDDRSFPVIGVLKNNDIKSRKFGNINLKINTPDKKAYGLVIDDPAMNSFIEANTTIIFSPLKEFATGKPALVHTKSGIAYFRYVHHDINTNSYILTTGNNSQLPMTISENDVAYVHGVLAVLP